jgi:hypothetical protein
MNKLQKKKKKKIRKIIINPYLEIYYLNQKITLIKIKLKMLKNIILVLYSAEQAYLLIKKKIIKLYLEIIKTIIIQIYLYLEI